MGTFRDRTRDSKRQQTLYRLLVCCTMSGAVSGCTVLNPPSPSTGQSYLPDENRLAAIAPSKYQGFSAVGETTASHSETTAASTPSTVPEVSLIESPIQLVSHLTTTDPVPVPAASSLSLMEALELAARNNPRMRVIAYVPLETATRQDVELAAFDASISAGGQWMQAHQQAASAMQVSGTGIAEFSQTSIGPVGGAPNLMQVEQRFTSGTTARIGMNSGFNQNSPGGQFLVVNPAYQSSLNAVIEQSLFRGYGSKANLTGLQIAKADQRQSMAEFQTELNAVLFEVQRNYWLAWLAQRDVQTYEKLSEQAELTWHIEQKRLEVGEGTLVEPAQAFEHLQTMRVKLEEARQNAKLAQNRLKSLLGVSASDPGILELTEQPIHEQIRPDMMQGVIDAMEARPEIDVCNSGIQQATLEVDRYKDFAKPDVSAFAGYALTGLDDGILGSMNRVASAEFGNASLGLRFNHVWGGRAASANVKRAELALSRQRRALRETQQRIEQDVREAHDRVETSWAVLQRQNDRLSAAQVQFDTYSKLYEAGQLDLDRLIRAQTLLANALHERQTALADYNISLITWNHVVGATTTAPRRPVPPMPKDEAGSTSLPETPLLREPPQLLPESSPAELLPLPE